MKSMFSIVVPIYNSDKYLSRCLDSIVHQTFSNLEIILIDNNSIDNSLKICQKYQQQDSRIKIYQNHIQGVSLSRNLGIKYSNGKYIYFLDSDDYLDLNCFEIINKILVTNNVDLVFFNYLGLVKNKKVNQYNLNTGLYLDINEVLSTILLPNLGVVWNKVFNLDIIKQNDIYFDTSYSLGEDLLFSIQYCLKIKSAYLLNKSLYFYTMDNPSSLMHVNKDFSKRRYDLFQIYDNLYQILPSKVKDIVLSEKVSTSADFIGSDVKDKKLYNFYKMTIKKNYKVYKENKLRYSLFKRIKVVLARYFSYIYSHIYYFIYSFLFN